MKKKYLVIIFAVLFIATNILSGYTAEKKDALTIAINAEPTTLDPSKANDRITMNVQRQLYDMLILKDEDGNLIPGLAEEWSVSNDGLEVTFNLRKDVKFHNGETMTAKDVVFSYERAIASSFTSRISGSMESMKQIDDNTVVLKLKFPYGPILACVASINMGIVSEKAVKENEEGFDRSPVGTGPYSLVEWKSGYKLIFKSFADYYRGEAAIKNLDYNIIPDSSTALIALEKGEVDMVQSPSPADKQNILGNSDLVLTETPQASYMFIGFNTETGVFSNKLLRQAVSYAVDREAVIIGGLDGSATALEVPMPPVCFGFPEGFKNNPYDPERAKQLLTEAGYPNGLKVKLRAMESPIYARPAEVIQENLRLVGIEAELDLMERGAFLKDVYTDCNYEIDLSDISALVPDADFITYTRFHSELVGGGRNFTRFKNAEMDKALETGRKSQSEEERIAAYLKVSEIVKEEAPLIPILVAMNMVAANKDLKGIEANALEQYPVYDYSW